MAELEQQIAEEGQELDQSTNALIMIFHALSHPVRFSICKFLLTKPRSVSELCELLELKQYAVSQQLAILRSAEILDAERQSRYIIYSLKSDAVRRILRVSMRNVGLDDGAKEIAQTPRASGFARIM